MRILLDTNIVVYREANLATKADIGLLFLWIDKLRYDKCIHPATHDEFGRLKPGTTREAMSVKLQAYEVLHVRGELEEHVALVCSPTDKTDNSRADTKLINEVYLGSVDALITEDRGIHRKATALGIETRVFTIDGFLEKVTSENPALVDYRVLSVKKEYFGEIDVRDSFFDSIRDDYPGFDAWFRAKAQEPAYVCRESGKISAFLYVKVEGESESYSDILPMFAPKRRLKIGTLKVGINGFRLGERLLKIVFDNALQFRVDEVYVTICGETLDKERLVRLLIDFGFFRFGAKSSGELSEHVFVRRMERFVDLANPSKTYPFIDVKRPTFIVPIYPVYHTSLFPDSILRTESPSDFIEHEPHRNAIRKVYVSRSINRDLQSGDNIVFYRTGGKYQGVVTTLGIVESVLGNIESPDEFIRLCRKRSVFSDAELMAHWTYSKTRPFIVNFLYVYSFPRRPNLSRLVELGVIKDLFSVPRGFEALPGHHFQAILKEAEAYGSSIID